MRFIEMWNPFTFAGGDIASERRMAETLRELYRSWPHVAGMLGFALAGLSAALSGAVASGIVATLVVLACLLFRILIERRYVARGAYSLDAKWIRLFVFGSLLSGFGWGLSAAILLWDTSAATQIITVGVACAIMQGAAGRAYMIPGTALFNILMIIGQMSIAAIAHGNYIFVPAGLLYFVFLTTFIAQMVNNRLRQLRAEQTADRLLAEITEKNELLRVANQALATKAYEDPLTGLANRRKFDLDFALSLAAAQTEGAALSLMMIDVDHFKSFNDTYGHQAGDECLLSLSRAINAAVSGTAVYSGGAVEAGSAGNLGKAGLPGDKSRSPDARLVARYGGEEFVVLLPGADRAEALAAAERIRLAVRLTALDALPNAPPRQTVSIGLVSCLAGPATTREAMLAAADEALYEAKKQGRNRVRVAAEPGKTQPKASAGR